MKHLIELIIRLRNPLFKFDDGLNTMALLQFIVIQSTCLIRGLKLLVFFRNPKWILLGRNVRFVNPSRIEWGKYVRLGDNVLISAFGKNKLKLGNSVGIGSYSQLVISASMYSLGQSIKIGNNVGIGEFAYLGGAGGLEIGDECIIGQYLSCHPENHNFNASEISYRFQPTTKKGIKIGRNCWIGSKVTILDGVVIGDNCVIAAGTVVTKSMPPSTVIGGVPAKVLKNIEPTLNVA